MEGILAAGSAVCALGAGLALTAGGASLPPGVREVRLRRAWERLRRLLATLATRPVVGLALGRRPWRNLAEALRAWLAGQGRELSLDEAASGLVLACGLTVLMGGVLSRSVVGAIATLGLCVLGARLLDSSRERRRSRELSESMPGIFRTLAIALGSGQTLTQAIDYVGTHERGPAGGEFARTSLRLRCGVAVEEALSLLADELEAPGMGLLVTALLISQRTGSPLRDLFQRSARLVERQGEFERSLSVKTAQVRLSVRIVCLLPVLMIALLSLISPDFQAGLASPVGTLSVALALAMDAAALLIIRRLMKGVL